MNIGIIGSEAAKFTPETYSAAHWAIRDLLVKEAGVPLGGTVSDQTLTGLTIVSGHCHLGGIDIWAENIADEFSLPKLIFPPARQSL